MTPENLLKAYDCISLINNGDWKTDPTKWFVTYSSRAEPEVNLISEHNSVEEARLGWAKAIIDFAEAE